MDRWKNWKRLNPLCLILALALVVCPATRAFAATTTYTATATASTFYATPFMFDSGFSTGTQNGLVRLYSDLTFDVQWTVNNFTVPNYPYTSQSYAAGSCSITLPNNLVQSGWNHVASSYDIIYDEIDNQYRQNKIITYSENKTSFSWSIYRNGENTNPSGLTSIKVRYYIYLSYVGISSGQYPNMSIFTYKNPDGTGIKPSVTGSVRTANAQMTPLSDLDPNSANISAIENAINNESAAANALDNANQVFVQDAAHLESNQAILENAADASVAAVDMDQVNLIDTYSQSVSFWGQLIGQLPSVLGSLWYVFIFGLLIAFVLFVLRIRR